MKHQMLPTFHTQIEEFIIIWPTENKAVILSLSILERSQGHQKYTFGYQSVRQNHFVKSYVCTVTHIFLKELCDSTAC
jgi:hypothetical protein